MSFFRNSWECKENSYLVTLMTRPTQIGCIIITIHSNKNEVGLKVLKFVQCPHPWRTKRDGVQI